MQVVDGTAIVARRAVTKNTSSHMVAGEARVHKIEDRYGLIALGKNHAAACCLVSLSASKVIFIALTHSWKEIIFVFSPFKSLANSISC